MEEVITSVVEKVKERWHWKKWGEDEELMYVEGLVRDVVEVVERGDIAIIKVNVRTSEGFYNYKTKYLAIVRKHIDVPYEEPFVRRLEVIEISIGAFQPLDRYDLEDILAVLAERYDVDLIEL
jgi:hypothetical protein